MNLPNPSPSLRFSEFKNIWRLFSFKDLYVFKTTNSLSRDFLNYESGSVKNIHYGDIHTKFSSCFDVALERVPYVDESVSLKKLKSEQYVKEGDLVIADASEDYKDIGKAVEVISLNGEKVIAGLHTFLARKVSNDIYIGFIAQLMQSWVVRHQVMRIAQGTKVLGLATSRLAEIQLLIPTVNEQQKIASFLSSVDKKISLLKEKHALLVQYKKGVMQKLFSQEVRFKAENGSDFPDWSYTKFDKVFERVIQKNKDNNQNVLTISAQRGLINQQRYFNKSVSAKDVTGYYLLDNGNFAYNKSYSKGYPMGAIKRLNNYDKGVVSTLYICFKSHEKQHGEFWEQYFEAGLLNREISKIAQEGARNHGLLNISVVEFFRDITVHAPNENEQIRIAEFLGTLDKKLGLVLQQIGLTQTFKKGLLQQMFV